MHPDKDTCLRCIEAALKGVFRLAGSKEEGDDSLAVGGVAWEVSLVPGVVG